MNINCLPGFKNIVEENNILSDYKIIKNDLILLNNNFNKYYLNILKKIEILENKLKNNLQSSIKPENINTEENIIENKEEKVKSENNTEQNKLKQISKNLQNNKKPKKIKDKNPWKLVRYSKKK